MSLNRYEQMLLNYVESRPEETAFWKTRVREIDRRKGRREESVLVLGSELWEYFEERARCESPFREVFIHEGNKPISMLNLSEYLLRVWPTLAPRRN